MPLPFILGAAGAIKGAGGIVGKIFQFGKGLFKGRRAKKKARKAAKLAARSAALEQSASATLQKLGFGADELEPLSKDPNKDLDAAQKEVFGKDPDELEIKPSFTSQHGGSKKKQPMLVWIVSGVSAIVGLMVTLFLVFRKKRR